MGREGAFRTSLDDKQSASADVRRSRGSAPHRLSATLRQLRRLVSSPDD